MIESKARALSIWNEIQTMPTSVRAACASGWSDRISVPAAAASKLIAYINRAVLT